MKARVYVTLKPSILDPQGKTITGALHSLGYDRVADVRQGKYFELDVEAESVAAAETLVTEVADTLLANPVIESYRVEVVGARDRRGDGTPATEDGRRKTEDGRR